MNLYKLMQYEVRRHPTEYDDHLRLLDRHGNPLPSPLRGGGPYGFAAQALASVKEELSR